MPQLTKAYAAYSAELFVTSKKYPFKESILPFERVIQEAMIKYIGFIAMGLADAIVEITGVHAGFLGVTNSTLFAGISGIVVGFSTAISMGSASLSASQAGSPAARHGYSPSSRAFPIYFRSSCWR